MDLYKFTSVELRANALFQKTININIKNKNSLSIYIFHNLFHKYNLGLQPQSSEINYNIYNLTNKVPAHFNMIYTSEEYIQLYYNKKLFAHLHCYDISRFNEIYQKYISIIEKYFSIII